MHQLAKFRQNRLNRGRDMAIFRFFKMAAVRHLGFVMRVLGPPTKSTPSTMMIDDVPRRRADDMHRKYTIFV